MPPHSLPRGTEGLVAFPSWSGQPDPGTSVSPREQRPSRHPKSRCAAGL